MPELLVRPAGSAGKVHDITPRSAGWSYVGFALYRLAISDVAMEETGDREAILVLVEGRAKVSAGGRDFGELGDRMDVFERKPPHAVYVPDGSDWTARATTACTACLRSGKVVKA
jgi:5-deoxy-glucuronate isomerase